MGEKDKYGRDTPAPAAAFFHKEGALTRTLLVRFSFFAVLPVRSVSFRG